MERCRTICRIVLVIVGVLIFSYAWGGWNIVKIGTCLSWCYQLKVGKGRNDDTNRVYVSGFNGHIYEWTYRGSWSYEDLGSGAQRMIAITVGNGRGDGVNRVYGSGWYTPIKEYTWTGSAWNKLNVSPGSPFFYLAF